MAVKRRNRRVSLAFMGEEWKGAYACFRYLTWEDAKVQREREAASRESGDDYSALEAMRETVMGAFVEGKVINEQDELVEATQEDMGSLDLDAIGVLYQRVLGVPDPNV